MITQLLLKLGLSEYEARIYSALLKHSPSSASFLARTCDLSRSSVYTTLGILTTKGLVSTSFLNNVRQFQAEDIDVFRQRLAADEQRLRERHDTLPRLQEQVKAFGQSGRHTPGLSVVEGLTGLQSIYLTMLRIARPHSTMHIIRDEFVWGPEWKFIFAAEWHQRVKHWRQEHDIQTRLLINPSAVERRHRAVYRRPYLHVRSLPVSATVKDYALYVINDMVAIMSFTRGEVVGIFATNATLAQNFLSLYESLWTSAKKLH